MANHNTCTKIAEPMMSFCYYCYFKACYFAGLFPHATT